MTLLGGLGTIFGPVVGEVAHFIQKPLWQFLSERPATLVVSALRRTLCSFLCISPLPVAGCDT